MNRVLLALTILGAGASGLMMAHQSTTRLTRETTANRAAWLIETQLLAAAQSDQGDLAARIRELKTTLAQSQPIPENSIRTAFQKRKGRGDWLPPELRQSALEEFGFNWQTSPDYIVVTKQAVRDTGAWMLEGAKLSDVAAVILAMTTEESSQIEEALQRAQADFNDWATAHVERKEPTPSELAHYVMPGDKTKISDKLAAGISAAIGTNRWAFMKNSRRGNWVFENVGIGVDGANFIIKRELTKEGPRLYAEIKVFFGPGSYDGRSGYLPEAEFPAAFRPVFPNGWIDLAKREGFEWPPPPATK